MPPTSYRVRPAQVPARVMSQQHAMYMPYKARRICVTPARPAVSFAVAAATRERCLLRPATAWQKMPYEARGTVRISRRAMSVKPVRPAR